MAPCAQSPSDEDELSLVRGGPVYRLLRRTGVVRGDGLATPRQVMLFVAATWAPMMLLALLQRLLVSGWDPLVRDFSVHARLLVAIPLLLIGDGVLDVLTCHATARFARGRFADDPRAERRVLDSARRLRDALAPELLMVGFAVLTGQVLFWEGSPSTGLLRSSTSAIVHSPANFWYAFIALPVAQFLFARWLWRWLIWSRLIWQFSRLKGELEPTHPDRKGGIEFLSDAATGFAAGLAAFSAVQSGAWLSRILFEGASAKEFFGDYWVLLTGALLFTHAPLLVWSSRLWRLRHAGGRKFGQFSVEYSRLFDHKWLERRRLVEDPLGSPDIQSLADLSSSFAVGAHSCS